MAKEGLRDKLGNRIGEIESDSSGKQIGRDMSLNRVGEYVSKSNVTRDRNGNRVGTGNLLSSLISKTLK